MASQEEDHEVTIYGFWLSPFVLRLTWALKLKGVSYKYIEEDIFNKSPTLLDLNPFMKKVPVLVHNQKALFESLIILEYIDETWKQVPLLPQDPYKRAMHRFAAKFVENKLFESTWQALYSTGEEKERALKSSIETMEKIEEKLKKKAGKFVGGENIGYVDLALGWMSYLLPVWEEVGSMKILDPVKFPATTTWISEFRNHPTIKDNFPDKEKMITYFQTRKEEVNTVMAGWRQQ